MTERKNRAHWIVVTILVAVVTAVAPHVLSLRRQSPFPPISIEPAIGMPGAPPTTASGLAERISAEECRLHERPDDIGAAVLLADALLRQARATTDGRPVNRAREVLRAVLHDNPGQYDAMRMLGAIHLSQHQFRDALTVARQARNLRPEDAWNYGVIGDALLELGEYDQAFETLDRMMALRPGAAAYARVVYARELRGNLDGALEAMEFAAKATPAQDPEAGAWYATQLGDLYLWTYYKVGRFDEAAKASRRALQTGIRDERMLARADQIRRAAPVRTDGQ